MNYHETKELYRSMSESQLEAAAKIFQALSCTPMTGRYGSVNDVFSKIGSEFALNRNRLKMEIRYLIHLCKELRVELTTQEEDNLEWIIADFNVARFLEMKAIEEKTHHDVKAVEYYIREQLDFYDLSRLKPYVHMGLTSEDVNNIAYAFMMKDLIDEWGKRAQELLFDMRNFAYRTRYIPILGHTHGQPATALTFGHAVAVDWARLVESFDTIKKLPIKMKCNGAVGNKAAMKFAYPEVDWDNFEQSFINSLGDFQVNPLTSQIENHDFIVRILNEVKLFSSIIENIGKNIEDYTCLRYLRQIPKEGEIGSSTMPHKVNPIDGENAWSNAITAEFAAVGLTQKLPQSKMQRDLSDSSSMRTIPTVFLHSYQAIVSMIKMLRKLEVNEEAVAKDLEENPEIISEAIQTILRKNGYTDAYEIMKQMTRGKKVTLESLREFITGLDMEPTDKERLLNLTPRDYIGNSEELVEKYCAN